MAAQGALRNHDGVDFNTFGFFIFTVADAAALVPLEVEAEIGQMAYVAAEETMYVRDATSFKPLSATTVTATTVAAETPAAPGTTTLPAITHIGDMFINVSDGLAWAAHDDPANPGTTIWSMIEHLNGTILVPDEAARQALTPPIGTLVVQQDTGWTYRYGPNNPGAPAGDETDWKIFSDFLTAADNAGRDALLDHDIHPGTWVGVIADDKVYSWTGNTADPLTDQGWMEVSNLPTVRNILQAQVFDPAAPGGHALTWHDIREQMAVVDNVVDLNDRTILPVEHLAVGKLVFVRANGKIYELKADPDTGTPPVTDTAADWADLFSTFNAPGLEGIVVAASAPADPGTFKWSDMDAAQVAATPPGGYYVVADPQTPVPAGVPDLATKAVKAGDWVVAIDGDGDGVTDRLDLVTLPAASASRPTITTTTTAGDTPATAPTTGAAGDEFINTADGESWTHDGTAWRKTWTERPAVTIVTQTGQTPTPAATPVATDQAASTAFDATQTNHLFVTIQRPPGVFVIKAVSYPGGTRTEATLPDSGLYGLSASSTIQSGTLIPDFSHLQTGQSGFAINPIPGGEFGFLQWNERYGAPTVGWGGASGIVAPADLPSWVSVGKPMDGRRDDILYNSTDGLLWIFDGTNWVEIETGGGDVESVVDDHRAAQAATVSVPIDWTAHSSYDIDIYLKDADLKFLFSGAGIHFKGTQLSSTTGWNAWDFNAAAGTNAQMVPKVTGHVKLSVDGEAGFAHINAEIQASGTEMLTVSGLGTIAAGTISNIQVENTDAAGTIDVAVTGVVK